MNTGCRHNVQHPIEAPIDEYGIGKQREEKVLLPILPSMHGPILGEKYFEVLAHQSLGHRFLVLCWWRV
jgi:hypothetical protein